MGRVRIDHVIYATGDLDTAAARVESELGLNAVRGGRHEGHGTHNRIVPLGGGYLELMAVADPEEAAGSPIGSALQARLTERGDVAEALREPGLPFFLARDHEVPDPGVGDEVGGITWLEVACDREELEGRLAGVPLPVRVVEGPPGVCAMGIGDREFRSA